VRKSCYSEGYSYVILRIALLEEIIMICCQCCGIEEQFNRAEATRKLREYRRGGPAHTTQLLLDALLREPVVGQTVLDVGGGVGAILHALLKAEAASATDVDASAAYLAAAREEAARQGHAERITYHHGNFVDIADTLAQADIVTLDRVICCYHDMPTLVERSSAKAVRLFGLVYPRNTWWVRAGVRAANTLMWLQRSSFRMFAHSSVAVDAIVRRNGFQQRYIRNAGLWQVVVYERSTNANAAP
jgi:magnesium-protoporphyrin O-methyltransferase